MTTFDKILADGIITIIRGLVVMRKRQLEAIFGQAAGRDLLTRQPPEVAANIIRTNRKFEGGSSSAQAPS